VNSFQLKEEVIMKTDVQKIVPCLWFDKHCEEAMNFYVSAFSGLSGENKESRIISVKRYEEGMETPGIEEMVGKVLTGEFELEGYRFIALDGGPVFQPNPSVSFMVNFDPSVTTDARKNLDRLWNRFTQGGKVLMELQEYPFSEHYGWIQDKYGISWQLILSGQDGEPRPFIIPSLMFTGDITGKAEEAANFYLSVFNNSRMGILERYPAGLEPDREGTVMYSDFMIENQWFTLMDSGRMHEFSFNEAISFMVNCIDQAEVDKLWDKLSNVPESEVCGWLKDKYGLSWQIIPEKLGELLSDPDKERANRVLNTMLHMKKIVISELEEAYVTAG
jgi:predicted 3-demethylubiquinone-9 3-methyltransferase (glyoxalase superfamily)